MIWRKNRRKRVLLNRSAKLKEALKMNIRTDQTVREAYEKHIQHELGDGPPAPPIATIRIPTEYGALDTSSTPLSSSHSTVSTTPTKPLSDKRKAVVTDITPSKTSKSDTPNPPPPPRSPAREQPRHEPPPSEGLTVTIAPTRNRTVTYPKNPDPIPPCFRQIPPLFPSWCPTLRPSAPSVCTWIPLLDPGQSPDLSFRGRLYPFDPRQPSPLILEALRPIEALLPVPHANRTWHTRTRPTHLVPRIDRLKRPLAKGHAPRTRLRIVSRPGREIASLNSPRVLHIDPHRTPKDGDATTRTMGAEEPARPLPFKISLDQILDCDYSPILTFLELRLLAYSL